jgi:hypothetical protein
MTVVTDHGGSEQTVIVSDGGKHAGRTATGRPAQVGFRIVPRPRQAAVLPQPDSGVVQASRKWLDPHRRSVLIVQRQATCRFSIGPLVTIV